MIADRQTHRHAHHNTPLPHRGRSNKRTDGQTLPVAVHGTSGSSSYETIPLESSGGVLSTVDMVVQRRDGPRRLCDHDDDDDDVCM